MSEFGDLTNVSVEKLQELETVLRAVLALPIARDTFAQIIDGMPTRTPYSDQYRKRIEAGSTFYSTIIDKENMKPSDEAMQEYEKIKASFAPQHLVIDLELAQKYQNAPAGSYEHSLRLLQIAAACLNTFAGMIYGSRYPSMEVKPTARPKESSASYLTTDDFYVKFYHTNYRNFRRYPFGLLNVLGYWAESEIFGGVLVFEREVEGPGIINAFLHPQKTALAFQLSHTQLERFALLRQADNKGKSVAADTLLPFTKEPNARVESTLIEMGEAPLRIFKNEYDKPPPELPPMNRNCVIRGDKKDPRAAKMKGVSSSIERFDRGEASDQDANLVREYPLSSSKEDPPSTDEEDL